ncbi:unnamed protein product [Caenorhabditis sp. 36 PRJEB53466]|nr:unnamed protein product [Caenorhabditis sp. 36 PRJEB53466]
MFLCSGTNATSSSLLEIPQTRCEVLLLLVFIVISSGLFIGQLVASKKRLIWKLFPEFCVSMTIAPLTHCFLLCTLLFKSRIFSSDDPIEDVFRRYVPVVIATYPTLFLPPVPFALTLTHSLLLVVTLKNWYLLGFKVSRGKINFFILAMTCALFFLRFTHYDEVSQAKRFVITIPVGYKLLVQMDMFKYVPIIITSACLVKKRNTIRDNKHVERMTLAEYAHLVHIIVHLTIFWKIMLSCFRQFCVWMPLTVLTHSVFLFGCMFPSLVVFADSPSREVSVLRLFIVFLIALPSAVIPTVPFSITLSYSLFLTFQVKPDSFILNCRVTKARITFLIVTLFIFFRIARYSDQNGVRFVFYLSSAPNLTLVFDLLKLIPSAIITFQLFRRFNQLLTSRRHEKVGAQEYAHLVHISLFAFISWSLFLTHTVLSILSYVQNTTPPHRGCLLGLEDSCIMQYLFVFSTLISDCKLLKFVFDRSKIFPVDQ